MKNHMVNNTFCERKGREHHSCGRTAGFRKATMTGATCCRHVQDKAHKASMLCLSNTADDEGDSFGILKARKFFVIFS